MPMHDVRRIAAVILLLVLVSAVATSGLAAGTPTAQVAETVPNGFLHLGLLNMIAARSSLVIRLGNFQGQCALGVAFGSGLAARTIGLVYVETWEDDRSKCNAAMQTLVGILNDPDQTITDMVFLEGIGLMFAGMEAASNVE